jgi:hypothetical protein
LPTRIEAAGREGSVGEGTGHPLRDIDEQIGLAFA